MVGLGLDTSQATLAWLMGICGGLGLIKPSHHQLGVFISVQ